jgi:hypothetical protein
MSIRHRPQHHNHGNARVPQSLIFETQARRQGGANEQGASRVAQDFTTSPYAVTRPQVDEAIYIASDN